MLDTSQCYIELMTGQESGLLDENLFTSSNDFYLADRFGQFGYNVSNARRQ